MIKFFRKIRAQLVVENKFSKYLIYSIGEIVLVVIGILIALSINNWNEANKESKEERKLLISLNTDFLENRARLENTIASEESMIRNSLALIQVMQSEDKSIDADSIANMVGRGAQSWWRAEFVTGTYSAIVGSGKINVLKNDDLKRILAEFSAEVTSGFEDHDESISYLIEFNKQSAEFSHNFLLPSQYKALELDKNETGIREAANQIITNKVFLGLLMNKTVIEKLRLDYQYKIQGYINDILELIKSELEK